MHSTGKWMRFLVLTVMVVFNSRIQASDSENWDANNAYITRSHEPLIKELFDLASINQQSSFSTKNLFSPIIQWIQDEKVQAYYHNLSNLLNIDYNYILRNLHVTQCCFTELIHLYETHPDRSVKYILVDLIRNFNACIKNIDRFCDSKQPRIIKSHRCAANQMRSFLKSLKNIWHLDLHRLNDLSIEICTQLSKMKFRYDIQQINIATAHDPNDEAIHNTNNSQPDKLKKTAKSKRKIVKIDPKLNIKKKSTFGYYSL